MPYQTIQFERTDGVGLVTLNRPDQLNALTSQMLEELLNVFKGMERDPEVRVIILTGAGKAFCGGEDFKSRAQFEVQAEPAPAPAPPSNTTSSFSYNPEPIAPVMAPTPNYSPLNPGPPPPSTQQGPIDPFAPPPGYNAAPQFSPQANPVTPEPTSSSQPISIPRPLSIVELSRKSYNPLLLQMRRMRKPIIGAINGVAAGTGLGLALACDMRYASDRARFIEVSVRVGMLPGGGNNFFLPRLIGLSRAMELAFMGDELGAAEAKELGLVNRVIPTDSLMEETRKLATRLAKGPTRAIGLAKNLMYESAGANLEQALEKEAQFMEEAIRSQDYKEGLKAFLEKRAPNFRGS